MSLRFILNGSNRVDTSTNVAVMPDTCTILAWILPTTIDATYQAVVEKTPAGYSDYRGVGINGTTGEVAGFMRRGSPSFTGIEVAKTGLLVANKWQFIGVQMDGTSASASDQKIFYANEKSLPSEVYSYTSQDPGSGATSPAAGATMVIGNNAGSSYAEGFPGLIHSVAIWGRKMDISEIRYWKQIMQEGKFKPSYLNSFFMYLGRNTGTQRDLSGNNFNGTITGAITVPSAPRYVQRFFAPWAASSGGASNFTQNLAGGLTPAGAVSRAASISRGGGLTPAAILRRSVIVIRNGVIVPGGALQKSTMITRGGLIVPSAAAQSSPSKSLAGSTTPAGSLRSDIAKALSGGITPGGTIETLKVALKDLAGSITASGTLTRAAAIVRSGSLSPSGILQKFAAIFRGGSATPAGSVDQSGGVSLDIGGSLTPAGLLTRSISQRLIGSLTPAAIVQKFVAMVRGGSMAPAGSAVSSRVLTRIFSGTIASTGAIARSVGKVLSGQTTAAGTLSRSIGKVLGGLVQLAGSLISSFLGNFTSGSVRIYDFESTRLELAETSGVETRDLPSVRLSIDDFIAV